MDPRSEFFLDRKYSLRRKATDTCGPLKAQHQLQYSVHPTMTAMVGAFVSIAFKAASNKGFTPGPSLGSQNATWMLLTKVMMLGHAVGGAVAVGDRCGAQGLLQVNQIGAFLVCVEVSPVR